MEKTVRELQKKFLSDRTNLLFIGTNRIVANIKLRTPVFLVEADKLRYMTESGIIYGEAKEPDIEKFPTLTGLFSERTSSYRLLEDQSVELRAEEKTIASEAIQLLAICRNKGLNPIKIEHIIYRGFSMILDENKTEIMIGRAPFWASIDRLHQILVKLKEKGKVATRIELDYAGKAFIKEKIL